MREYLENLLTDEDIGLLVRIENGMNTDVSIAHTRLGRRMRSLYLKGYIGAEPQLHIDGPPHDKLWLTDKGKEVIESLE